MQGYLEYTGRFRKYRGIQNIERFSEYTGRFRIYRDIHNIQGDSEYTGIFFLFKHLVKVYVFCMFLCILSGELPNMV